MNALILFLLGLDAIQHLAVARNQGAEVCKLRLIVLKEGELFSSCHAAAESTGLPHVVRAGHGFAPQRSNPLRDGCSSDESRNGIS